MTEPFLSLGAGEQAETPNTVAARIRRPAVILEKGTWVCCATPLLLPNHHPMAIKGSTSFSKVHGSIDRFSEDVNITLDCRDFDDKSEPFVEGTSRNRIGWFSEYLRDQVARQARHFVAPALDAAAERLATGDSHDIQIDDDGVTVRFAYPSAVEVPRSYITGGALLEFGGSNGIDPNERHEVCSDIAALTQEPICPSATVTVLSLARTYWGKANLIHVACRRRQLAIKPDRLSRHWFDLYCLGVPAVGRAALSDRALLRMSFGTRRCSSTLATPTMTTASTVSCVRCPTKTKFPPCDQTTKQCKAPSSSVPVHVGSTR